MDAFSAVEPSAFKLDCHALIKIDVVLSKFVQDHVGLARVDEFDTPDILPQLEQ